MRPTVLIIRKLEKTLTSIHTPRRALYTTPRNMMPLNLEQKPERATPASGGEAHQVIQSDEALESLHVLLLVASNIDNQPE